VSKQPLVYDAPINASEALAAKIRMYDAHGVEASVSVQLLPVMKWHSALDESYVTVMPTHVAEASQAAVHCAYVKLPDCNTLPVQKAFLIGGTLCAGQLCADTPHGRASSATASAAKTCFAAAPSPARPRARIPVRATQHSAAPPSASKAPRAAALADGVLQAAAASRSGAGNGAVSTAGAA
jgi:hypothetical protein